MSKIYINDTLYERVDNPHFTQEERQCLDLITEAWNAFINLPQYHPSDIDEVRLHIHALQEKIMVRIAQRELGWIRLSDGRMADIHPEEADDGNR